MLSIEGTATAPLAPLVTVLELPSAAAGFSHKVARRCSEARNTRRHKRKCRSSALSKERRSRTMRAIADLEIPK